MHNGKRLRADVCDCDTLGYLSQQEFSRQIEPFISIDPSREHLHNQLLCAILTNTYRDPPEAAVAGWVSANDKPTMGLSKPAAGDASEQRLKTEVMQLPPRMRLRMKGVKDVSQSEDEFCGED